jgi:hypothetical protein
MSHVVLRASSSQVTCSQPIINGLCNPSKCAVSAPFSGICECRDDYDGGDEYGNEEEDTCLLDVTGHLVRAPPALLEAELVDLRQTWQAPIRLTAADVMRQ